MNSPPNGNKKNNMCCKERQGCSIASLSFRCPPPKLRTAYPQGPMPASAFINAQGGVPSPRRFVNHRAPCKALPLRTVAVGNEPSAASGRISEVSQ